MSRDQSRRVEALEEAVDLDATIPPEERMFYEELAEQIATEEAKRDSGVGSPDFAPERLAWLKALQLAPKPDLQELAVLFVKAQDEGRERPDVYTDPAYFALRETMMRRAVPVFADTTRYRRDLLYCELKRLAAEWPARSPVYWVHYALSGSAGNRMNAVCRGDEPITEPAEARRLAAEALERAKDPVGRSEHHRRAALEDLDRFERGEEVSEADTRIDDLK